MKKSKVNTFVDVIAIFPFVITIITSIGIWIFMRSGGSSRSRAGAIGPQLFFGVAYHTWIEVHAYAGLALIALIALHLILHSDYIKGLPRLFKRG